MAKDDRLVESLAEMLIKQDPMVSEFRDIKGDIRNIKGDIGNIKEDINKLNLLSAENTRAVIKLADKMEGFANLDPRVRKLESAVFK